MGLFLCPTVASRQSLVASPEGISPEFGGEIVASRQSLVRRELVRSPKGISPKSEGVSCQLSAGCGSSERFSPKYE